MKRYLLVSLAAAALPALGLGWIMFSSPGKDAAQQGAPAPVTATEEAIPEPKPFLTKEQREAAAGERFDRMRDLLDTICEDEERMAARVKRVMDERELTDRRRTQLLSELAHRSAKEGLSEASEMLDAAHLITSEPMRVALYSGVLQSRAGIDNLEALKLCGVLHEAADRQAARNFVVRHWALQDFEAATRAVEHLDLPEERFYACEGLLAAAGSKPEEVERMIARKDLHPDVAVPLVGAYASGWRGSLDDLKTAVPSSASSPMVMTALMAGYAGNHPLEAIPYLQQHSDAVFGKPVVQRMGEALASGKPAAALEKIASGSGFKERDDLVSATFQTWMMIDFKSAGDWLKKNDALLGNPDQADDLRLLMAKSMKHGGATESAEAWTRRIQDPAKREAALRYLESDSK